VFLVLAKRKEGSGEEIAKDTKSLENNCKMLDFSILPRFRPVHRSNAFSKVGVFTCQLYNN